MPKEPRQPSRRQFITLTGTGVLAARPAAAGPFFVFAASARPKQKTLKILQWNHFLPEYDRWFDGVLTVEWGRRHDTTVIVDRVPIGEIHTRAASEAAGGKGHDLVLFPFPPASFENRVIDHTEIYREVERKHGKVIRLGHASTYNPRTRKYFAFMDSYVPAPLHFLQDYWGQVGFPLGPDSYDSLRRGATQIREKFGIPCGLGLAPELDSSVAMQGLLWSFGGSVQDERGNVAINSKGTIEALRYMKALYQDLETPEALAWDSSSNDRAILSGKVSCVINAIGIVRRAEKENPEASKRIQLAPGLRGPARWLASPHVAQCCAIWDFAENKDGASQFLADLIDNFGAVFKASEYCNFPAFPSTVPDLKIQLFNDPRAQPNDKYNALRDALDWTTNIGHPGYATAAIEDVFHSFVIPKMFADVARGNLSPEEGAATAEKEVKWIFEKWKRA